MSLQGRQENAVAWILLEIPLLNDCLKRGVIGIEMLNGTCTLYISPVLIIIQT